MQFNDIFFSTQKLFKPALLSFIAGFFSLIIFNYLANINGWSPKVASNLVFISMLVVFFITRYFQAKKILQEYKRRKAKLKKRNPKDSNNDN